MTESMWTVTDTYKYECGQSRMYEMMCEQSRIHKNVCYDRVQSMVDYPHCNVEYPFMKRKSTQ